MNDSRDMNYVGAMYEYSVLGVYQRRISYELWTSDRMDYGLWVYGYTDIWTDLGIMMAREMDGYYKSTMY